MLHPDAKSTNCQTHDLINYSYLLTNWDSLLLSYQVKFSMFGGGEAINISSVGGNWDGVSVY